MNATEDGSRTHSGSRDPPTNRQVRLERVDLGTIWPDFWLHDSAPWEIDDLPTVVVYRAPANPCVLNDSLAPQTSRERAPGFDFHKPTSTHPRAAVLTPKDHDDASISDSQRSIVCAMDEHACTGFHSQGTVMRDTNANGERTAVYADAA